MAREGYHTTGWDNVGRHGMSARVRGGNGIHHLTQGFPRDRLRDSEDMVITYSKGWINRVRLPILLVVSWTGKMNILLSPCVPENLVSRDGFSRPVPRQPAHSPYSG